MRPVRVRLICSAGRVGPENMAVDEYLMRWHLRALRPVLRTYAWDPPAISIGRYQTTDRIYYEACRKDGVTVVRRITGGGAIFHDSEVTYSFVCPERGAGSPISVSESFERLNGFIIHAYRTLGLDARYAKQGPGANRFNTSDHFCFSGSQEFDICIGGRKIGGNAQRRTRGVIMQHGSIPLSIDLVRVRRYFRDGIDQTRFTSLRDALGWDIGAEQVVRAVERAFSEMMSGDLIAEELSAVEENEVRSIMNQRYLREEWNSDGRLEEHEDRTARMA
ncbi:MAG: hypothetical protein A2176_13040 [Spirochaetes bacterium RBG_13_51_14]|nr:MAG: hypothetical protein A2176_13040 [Spirochaetes bacterium RBG_13_51_14]